MNEVCCNFPFEPLEVSPFSIQNIEIGSLFSKYTQIYLIEMNLFSIILATITRFVHHLTIQAHNILLRIVDLI